MVHVLVRHKVKDYTAWRAVFDGVKEMRDSGGETSFQVFTANDDPNNVWVLVGWDSLENAKAFFDDPKLKAAMQEAGVIEHPDIYYLDEK